MGIAVASKFLAVGAPVPYAEAGVGAVATQSYANTSYGPRALAALKAGMTLEAIHESFKARDPDHALRQYGLVDSSGHSLSFTGSDCFPWAGGISRDNLAIQGNLLAGEAVVLEMLRVFEASTAALPEKLLSALQAGDAAGGDKRGRQSAALVVVREAGGYGGFDDRYIDLRVDDHADPVVELRRLLELRHLYFEKPRTENILPIEGAVAERLVNILQRSGFLEGLNSWGPDAEKALRDLAGFENLEDRMLEVGQVDRVVLEHLEHLYSA